MTNLCNKSIYEEEKVTMAQGERCQGVLDSPLGGGSPEHIKVEGWVWDPLYPRAQRKEERRGRFHFLSTPPESSRVAGLFLGPTS